MLRFSGFEDNWEIKKLDELSKIQRGASPRPISSKKWYDFENKNVGWVRIGDVTSSSKYLTETEDYFSEEGVKKSRFLPKGSLIMSICATIGKPIITDIDTCIHDGFVGFSELSINKEFLYYYLNILEPKFYSLSQTGSQANLNSDLVRISKIGVPSVKEQEKIVNFLSMIDKKIWLLEKKYKSYVDFKKYLMQQIFAQKLRFNFIDDWDVVKLETLIEKGKAGGTPPSTNPDYYNGEIPFLSIKDMTEQGKYIVKTEKSITEEGLNNSSAWIIPKYSLLYSIYASIGLVSINLTEVSTSQAIYGIILKEGVSLEYMYYYLTYFKKNIHRYVETGTQGNLNAKLLKSFEIALPSVDEQEMIVNILSLVDKKIENMEKEVGKMNEFKKGLLQQMFI